MTNQPVHFVEPELATLADAMPDGPDCIFEIKYDGYRMLATVDTEVTLVTRNNVDWTQKFSGIATSLAKLGMRGTLLDGEIVSITSGGVSNFEKLHDDIKDNNQGALRYYVFDLLFLDGNDMRALMRSYTVHNVRPAVVGKAGSPAFHLRATSSDDSS